MLISGDGLLALLRNVFSDFVSYADYFAGRAILTAKKKDVKVINDLMLGCIPTRKISYFSTDQVCEVESQLLVPMEIQNTIENESLPPHVLDLKIGVRIMVIRNIDPAAGICNGTRFIVTSLGTNVIEATIATCPHASNFCIDSKNQVYLACYRGRLNF